MIDADHLPFELLAALAVLAWLALGLVRLHDAQRVRRDDRDAERRALRVLVERVADGEPDDHVEHERSERRADERAEDDHDVHARRVAG